MLMISDLLHSILLLMAHRLFVLFLTVGLISVESASFVVVSKKTMR